MTNNDIIRSLRYTFDFSDSETIEIFNLAGLTVTAAEVNAWLKKDDAPEFLPLNDLKFASFLNGLIIKNRGQKEGAVMVPEKSLNNNIILRKLKIAMDLKDEDILGILLKTNLKISKHELSALFRKPGQSQYRECKDQILRNFLQGLKINYRDK